MDEQQDAPQETVITPLDAVVLDGPKTAGELLVTALRSDMQVLANALMLQPGSTFTLQLNVNINFTHSDLHEAIKAAGFEVTMESPQ